MLYSKFNSISFRVENLFWAILTTVFMIYTFDPLKNATALLLTIVSGVWVVCAVGLHFRKRWAWIGNVLAIIMFLIALLCYIISIVRGSVGHASVILVIVLPFFIIPLASLLWKLVKAKQDYQT